MARLVRGGAPMRDANDTVTAEIPGVEPLPPKPVRVTHAEKRLLVCYQDPKTVRTCRNCRHREGSASAEHDAHRCGKDGFPVALGGVCVDHEE